MRLRLVAVGLEGPFNVGQLLRLSENFDVDEVYLVSPVASLSEASRWAARASGRLKNVAVVSSLDEALRGVELSICTSDEASARDVLRTAVTPEEAAEMAASRGGTVALVLGRESVGLTREELRRCDVLSAIPTSPKYTAMNVSNAAAVLLYVLYRQVGGGRRVAEAPERRSLDLLEAYARALAMNVYRDQRDVEEVALSARKAAARASRVEAEALLTLLSKLCSRIGCESKARELIESYSK